MDKAFNIPLAACGIAIKVWKFRLRFVINCSEVIEYFIRIFSYFFVYDVFNSKMFQCTIGRKQKMFEENPKLLNCSMNLVQNLHVPRREYIKSNFCKTNVLVKIVPIGYSPQALSCFQQSEITWITLNLTGSKIYKFLGLRMFRCLDFQKKTFFVILAYVMLIYWKGR